MLTRMRSAVSHMIGGIMASGGGASEENEKDSGANLPPRFPYCRPDFLGLCAEELECLTDHISRPILHVKEGERLPWSTGYAE